MKQPIPFEIGENLRLAHPPSSQTRIETLRVIKSCINFGFNEYLRDFYYSGIYLNLSGNNSPEKPSLRSENIMARKLSYRKSAVEFKFDV